jgi:hypothetical protein
MSIIGPVDGKMLHKLGDCHGYVPHYGGKEIAHGPREVIAKVFK